MNARQIRVSQVRAVWVPEIRFRVSRHSGVFVLTSRQVPCGQELILRIAGRSSRAGWIILNPHIRLLKEGDPVSLVNLSFLHHKADVLQQFDVGERVSVAAMATSAFRLSTRSFSVRPFSN